MMSTKQPITLEYLKELKELDLSPDESQEALQSSVTLIQDSVKARDISTAKGAYILAKYWGDDKDNADLFTSIGKAITQAEASVGKEKDKLTKEAGVSFASKNWKKAKEIFSKVLQLDPQDKAIAKRLKEVEAKLNPPAPLVKKTQQKPTMITVTSIAGDVNKIVNKLGVVIDREQGTGRSVARLVKSRNVLRRMARHALVE